MIHCESVIQNLQKIVIPSKTIRLHNSGKHLHGASMFRKNNLITNTNQRSTSINFKSSKFDNWSEWTNRTQDHVNKRRSTLGKTGWENFILTSQKTTNFDKGLTNCQDSTVYVFSRVVHYQIPGISNTRRPLYPVSQLVIWTLHVQTQIIRVPGQCWSRHRLPNLCIAYSDRIILVKYICGNW